MTILSSVNTRVSAIMLKISCFSCYDTFDNKTELEKVLNS